MDHKNIIFHLIAVLIIFSGIGLISYNGPNWQTFSSIGHLLIPLSLFIVAAGIIFQGYRNNRASLIEKNDEQKKKLLKFNVRYSLILAFIWLLIGIFMYSMPWSGGNDGTVKVWMFFLIPMLIPFSFDFSRWRRFGVFIFIFYPIMVLMGRLGALGSGLGEAFWLIFAAFWALVFFIIANSSINYFKKKYFI